MKVIIDSDSGGELAQPRFSIGVSDEDRGTSYRVGDLEVTRDEYMAAVATAAAHAQAEQARALLDIQDAVRGAYNTRSECFDVREVSGG
jgi:hypothetical protein